MQPPTVVEVADDTEGGENLPPGLRELGALFAGRRLDLFEDAHRSHEVVGDVAVSHGIGAPPVTLSH